MVRWRLQAIVLIRGRAVQPADSGRESGDLQAGPAHGESARSVPQNGSGSGIPGSEMSCKRGRGATAPALRRGGRKIMGTAVPITPPVELD
jgi:hypothetical protein